MLKGSAANFRMVKLLPRRRKMAGRQGMIGRIGVSKLSAHASLSNFDGRVHKDHLGAAPRKARGDLLALAGRLCAIHRRAGVRQGPLIA